MEKVYKRRKAFIGAIIGAAASVAGGIIGGNKKKRAAREEARRVERQNNYNNAIASANSLNQDIYNEQEYKEDFLEQRYKYGGESKMNKKYNNRNKKGFGGIGEIVGSVIGGIGTVAEAATGIQGLGATGNAIGGLANNTIKSSQQKALELEKTKANEQIMNNQQPIDVIKSIRNYRDRLPNKLPMMPTYRCGGTVKRR